MARAVSFIRPPNPCGWLCCFMILASLAVSPGQRMGWDMPLGTRKSLPRWPTPSCAISAFLPPSGNRLSPSSAITAWTSRRRPKQSGAGFPSWGRKAFRYSGHPPGGYPGPAPEPDPDRLAHIDALEECARKQLQERPCLSLRDLAVGGRDLMALGLPAGPQLGSILKELLSAVIDGELPNQKKKPC